MGFPEVEGSPNTAGEGDGDPGVEVCNRNSSLVPELAKVPGAGEELRSLGLGWCLALAGTG